MKKKPTWFKLYPADFLADRNVERMNIGEFGLYCYLLMRGWMDGGIPASLDELSRYAMLRGISRKRLAKSWEAVRQCWEQSTSDPNKLVNPRQEIERVVVGEYWDAKVCAGKASAAKRKKQKDDASTQVGTTDERVFNTPGNNIDLDIRQQTNTCASNGDAPVGGSLPPVDDPPFSAVDPNGLFAGGSTPKSDAPAEPLREFPAQQEAWFTAWWAAYWLRKAKKAAREAFRKRVKTQQRFQCVMAATRAQTPEMLSREPSKRPHGASWLNGERWEDETPGPSPAAVSDDYPELR